MGRLNGKIAVVTGGAQARGETVARIGRPVDSYEVARACVDLASDDSGLMIGANIDFGQNVVGAGDPPLEP